MTAPLPRRDRRHRNRRHYRSRNFAFQGFDGIITVYGAEPELPYHRASLSKDLLDADLSPEAVALGDADFWANRRITVVTGTSVVTVRPGHRSVVLDTRDEVSYDALILATGVSRGARTGCGPASTSYGPAATRWPSSRRCATTTGSSSSAAD